jgi:hypothetical protein
MDSKGNNTSSTNLTRKTIFFSGWQRDLTMEGIESNPGPTWKEFVDKLKERCGDEQFAKILSVCISRDSVAPQ